MARRRPQDRAPRTPGVGAAHAGPDGIQRGGWQPPRGPSATRPAGCLTANLPHNWLQFGDRQRNSHIAGVSQRAAELRSAVNQVHHPASAHGGQRTAEEYAHRDVQPLARRSTLHHRHGHRKQNRGKQSKRGVRHHSLRSFRRSRALDTPSTLNSPAISISVDPYSCKRPSRNPLEPPKRRAAR